ncbi:MAG TPA: amidohydrolase family protein [Planctomycetota bacterium]|nr:amidohydrolase family protein [Planctomycetota bacterium]
MQCVKAKLVYTGRGTAENSYVVFEKGKVVGLSRSRKGELLGEFGAVTPALLDAHAHIGMHRSGEPGGESESNEKLDSFVNLADALDSVQMDDRAFADSLRAGVLYSCVVPGSGNIVGGRSAVLRNFARGTTEALVGRAGIKGAFGYNPMSTRDWKGTRPHTRMGALALLRSKLLAVRQKMEKRARLPAKKRADVEFAPDEEVLRALLERREVFRVHVHKADDIDALLRIADEFRLRITCEHTMDVWERRVYDELARRDIPVVYGPLDSFAYKVELRHEDPLNVRHLVGSGVRFGLMTDHPVILQSTLLMCLRWFLRAGLSKSEALEIVTRRNAEILGVADRLGTLERGRWASLVCWDGDPFDLAHKPVLALGEGREVYRA